MSHVSRHVHAWVMCHVMSRTCMSPFTYIGERVTSHTSMRHVIYTIEPCVYLHGSHECNTLQHTATHYNTLQHTATHCSVLQCVVDRAMCQRVTATYCNTLQCADVCCSVLMCITRVMVHVPASHCNTATLQHMYQPVTATLQHGNTMQHTVTHCNACINE